MVVAAHPWETIVQEAATESSLWAEALRPEQERELEPVFSLLLGAQEIGRAHV